MDDWASVLATDYTSYAILYECSERYPAFLNFENDDVAILTRAETVSSAVLLGLISQAETLVPNAKNRIEILQTGKCEAGNVFTAFAQAFTDPDYFYRKW